MLRMMNVMVLAAMAFGLPSCATELGQGRVYGATYPASEERTDPSNDRALAVYGAEYPAKADMAVSAPGPKARGLTVYGFDYSVEP